MVRRCLSRTENTLINSSSITPTKSNIRDQRSSQGWILATNSSYSGGGGWVTDDTPYAIRLQGIVQPQILISNYTGAYNPGTESRLLSRNATPVTTGNSELGYLLTKVTHRMRLEVAGTGIITVSVAPDINGIPDATLYDFPQQTITNTAVQAVTHVGEVLLEPNRKYWIGVERFSDPHDRIQIYYKRSDDVDTGQPDWLLATTSSQSTGTGYESLPSLFSLRLEGIILAPVTNEPRYRDFPMDASTPGRLKLGETSTGTLDAVDDNRSGDLLKIEGLTPGNSYRVRAWFGTSKEDSATAARGGAIGLQFSRAGIELASLSPHNDNLLDDGRASFAFPAFANDEYYVDLVAPAFRPPDGTFPAAVYFGPYMLEIYDLGLTQTQSQPKGYGIKATNICVNNRCYNDPRFPEFHVDGHENRRDSRGIGGQ